MDILDNIMFATKNRTLRSNIKIESSYIDLDQLNDPQPPVIVNPGGPVPIFSYPLANKFNFCAIQDNHCITRGIKNHWYHIDKQEVYSEGGDIYASFIDSSNYHLIYAYLIENTRIFQIFERLIEKTLVGEELGISDDPYVFDWINNSIRLFFQTDSPKILNLKSVIRPNSDHSRRNAYYRMFGMDLAFGDIDSKQNIIPYYKAKASNQQFVPLFERFLTEVWQGYINARNTAGVNTSDVNVLGHMAEELREMLIARRGNENLTYAHQNLSKEEYSSVLMSNWFSFIISFDSPLVTFLNCQSSTIGERLLKIGEKMGVPAHKKCQALFEMADPASSILLAIETGGLFDDSIWLQDLLSSLNPNTPPNIHSHFMTELLTVITNWEKATGHPIKNPESRISGSVKIQNGVKTQNYLN